MYFNTNNVPKRFADRELLTSNNDVSFTKQGGEFYQFEPGIVLDIILDDKHPLFKINSEGGLAGKIIVPNEFPVNYKNEAPVNTDMSYATIGCILVRLCYSQQSIGKEDVVFAYPMDNSNTTFPLLNELVQVTCYLDKYYYTNKINYKSIVNASADLRLESTYGNNYGNRQHKNVKGDITGPTSKMDSLNTASYPGMRGILGNYFWFNNKIRGLRRREGDTVIESRFGQSIRFGSYDDNRENDQGADRDYKGDGQTNSFSNTKVGGGNPFLLIRNKQRPIEQDKEQQIYPRVNPIPKIEKNEKNSDGYVIEDVNNDGSSFHLTSGLTVSKFITTCYKTTFCSDISEEQQKFSPKGSTPYVHPTLNGNQVVLNSDRLILSSKSNETLHYSKRRYSIVTDDEYTVDSHGQIVLNTNNKTVINSPAIYLGEYNQTAEPALLGQTTVNWLYDLCNWLLAHTHWHKHGHFDAGSASPDKTQRPVEQQQLIELRDSLHTLLSRRVFITGGGFAPGYDGMPLTDEQKKTVPGQIQPVKIDVHTGSGVPGTFHGVNKRL